MVADGMGVITRIALKNFVTYDEVVVKPGKNLNLIIGANGTGKSTIVGAIALGLGGGPKLMGRGDKIREYVKAGHTNASIEIDLQNGSKKVVTVKREFDINNHTTWFINNQPSNGKLVGDLMKQFNIQVDNLCQFLPQDKVQEFSNLSPQELLVETERSVGDPKLLEYHTKLKDLRTQQAELEKQLETCARLLKKEKATCDTLKDSVGHIEEQKTIEEKLKSLRQKKAWLVYIDKRDEFGKAKVERDEAKKTKDNLEKKMKPIELEIVKLKTVIKTLETTARQKNSETSDNSIVFNKLQEKIEEFEETIAKEEKECQEKIVDEQETDKRINELNEQMNKCENDLAHKISEIGSVEKIETELASILKTVNNHRNAIGQIKAEQNFLLEKKQNCIRKIQVGQKTLADLENVEAERLRLLQRLNKDAFNGVMWLRSNKHLFSKPIYEPMILLINVKDARYAKYFENHISNADLFAFVCEDKSDMSLLLNHLRSQQQLRINAVHSDPNRDINYQSNIPIEHLRQFGFEHYMLSLIDAPKTVLNYLVKNYSLNNIPIGNDNILRHLDNIPTEIRRFFSAQKVFSIKFSQYSGDKSTTESFITPRNYLSFTLDTQRINQIQNELTRLEQEQNLHQKKMDALNEQITTEEQKANSHKEMRRKLETDKVLINDLKRKICMTQKKLEQQRVGRKSVDEIRAESKTKVENLILEQLQRYKTYNQALDAYYKVFVDSEEMKIQVKIRRNELIAKESNSRELRENYENAERNFRNLENEMMPLRQELETLFEEAKRMTAGVCSSETEKFKKYQDVFKMLPATVEEIIEEIQRMQAKAFNVNDRNEVQRILNQFAMAKRNAEKCTKDINIKERELIQVTEEITKIKDEWLLMLNSLVEKINQKFSSCFAKMKCAGEVSLDEGSNPMDFAKYGLRIKVKFRDADELQALSRHVQSGGERTVTTAAYMISLQELTRVPFRCVDEINQGMDATNERRVFEMIVEITSTNNSAQYFLLTPKLLPNLKYSESMTVLTVFNGKYMVPSSEFSFGDNIDNICKVLNNRSRAER